MPRRFCAIRLTPFCLLLAAFSPTSAASLPFLSPLFGEATVLQRDQPNRLWGWTDPGQRVAVTLGESRATAVAGPDGRWSVEIAPPTAGGPYTRRLRRDPMSTPRRSPPATVTKMAAAPSPRPCPAALPRRPARSSMASWPP